VASRRWGVGVLVVVVAAIGAAGVVFSFRPSALGPPIEHRFEAGGFTLTLPSGWMVKTRFDDPYSWVEAYRPTRLGPADAWLWVSRLAPDDADPMGRLTALADIKHNWGRVDVDEGRVRVNGNTAVRLRYTHPYIKHLGFLPGGSVAEVRYRVAPNGEMYEVGVAGHGRLPAELRDIDHLIHLAPPVGTRAMEMTSAGFRIDVPASWNRSETPRDDMPDAAWVATAPPDPPAQWGILWTFDEPVARAIEESASKARRDGHLTGRADDVIDGRPATRIDFDRPATSGAAGYFSTWIFEGPDGRAWQLLVGSLRPDRDAATRIAATFQVDEG
jgi:hypothetical protein